MNKGLLIIILFAAFISSCRNDEGKSTNKDSTVAETPAALEQLRKKVTEHADSAAVRLQLIDALDSLGMYKEAVAQADSLILQDSANNGLWFRRAQLLESGRDTTGAILSYQRAIAVYPSIESQLSLANLYAETKNPKCLPICHDISRMGLGRETDAHCDFVTAVYYARTGLAKQALSLFDRCINNNYTYMVAYMEKGFIYYDQKKYNDALAVFKTAITVNNTYADAYYWQAKCYEAMGNKQEALVNYQRSLSLDKTLNEAREGIDRLKM